MWQREREGERKAAWAEREAQRGRRKEQEEGEKKEKKESCCSHRLI